jgi:hypothetical protein
MAMSNKLKILIFIKQFWKELAKHRGKYDFVKSIEEFADVIYWTKDGDAVQILKYLETRHHFKPDFLFMYDHVYQAFAPNIYGLDQLNIPKGYYVMDVYFPASKKLREDFMKQNHIDLVFSVTKQAFLKQFPQYKEKFRWLPFSINPDIYKDYQQPKTMNYLLMGLVHYPKAGTYPFREAVLKQMKNEKGFVYYQHPGHLVKYEDDAYVNEKYAKEINRAKIFFTCGSIYQYPVLKFFEAPACHTLLLAEASDDIYELGFKDRVHFVACDEKNVYEKAKYYLQHNLEREQITKSGYEFIHSHHTNRKRAMQFIDYINRFLDVGSER